MFISESEVTESKTANTPSLQVRLSSEMSMILVAIEF